MSSVTTGPVVFLGSDDVAARCLATLVERVDVTLVVTPPERRRGRRGTPEPAPPGRVAAALGIPVLATPDVNAPEALERLRLAAPRLLVVVAFGQLLRRAVRTAAPLGGINLHFSLLPRWRGAAPVQRALLAGDTATGIAVQRVVRRLDAGPVLALEELAIHDDDDAPALLERLTARGAPLLADVAERLLRGEDVPATEQDETRVTVAPRIEKHEGALHLEQESGLALSRRVRAFGEWPGCRLALAAADGELEVVRVRRAAPEQITARVEPGTVLAADPTGIVVAARDGALRLLELQRSGGRPLPVRDFLLGRPVAVGSRVHAVDASSRGDDADSRS